MVLSVAERFLDRRTPLRWQQVIDTRSIAARDLLFFRRSIRTTLSHPTLMERTRNSVDLDGTMISTPLAQVTNPTKGSKAIEQSTFLDAQQSRKMGG
jgi:hypothetical protein